MWSLEINASLVAIIVVGILQSNLIRLDVLLKRIIGSLIFLTPIALSIRNWSYSVWRIPGLSFSIEWNTLMLISGITILVAIIDYFMAGDKENMESYPPIRNSIWSFGLLLKSTLTWIVFLTCYEMIFRGVFFFYTAEKMGLIQAVLLNTIVCSLVHAFKSKREAFMSIPMALLLCYIAWTGGSFWYAALLHVALAIVHEISSILSNPKMQFAFAIMKK